MTVCVLHFPFGIPYYSYFYYLLITLSIHSMHFDDQQVCTIGITVAVLLFCCISFKQTMVLVTNEAKRTNCNRDIVLVK